MEPKRIIYYVLVQVVDGTTAIARDMPFYYNEL